MEWVNKIIQGDCKEIMARFPNNCIDLTVTSPPYDNLRTYGGYTFDFKETAKELYRITKNGGVVVWVIGDATINGSETGTSFRQALYFKEIGFNLHDTMIYEKDAPANPSSNRYHQIFEYMFIFSKRDIKVFNPIKDRKNIYRKVVSGTRRQKDGTLTRKKSNYFLEWGLRNNIWRYGVGYMKTTTYTPAYQHPAIFPEKLAEDHIISWSNPKDLILDPMCGSGTTCLMAKKLGRRYIGIDISEKYCQMARQRLSQMPESLF